MTVALVVALVALGTVVLRLSEALRFARRRADASALHALQLDRRFAESFQSAPFGLTLTSLATNRIFEVNAAFEKLTGWTRDEIVGKTAAELGLYPDADLARLERRVRRSGKIRDHRERLHCKGGGVREVVIAMDWIEIRREPYVLGTIVDETERSRVEAELRSSDEKLRDLASAIDEVFWLSTPARDRTIYVSPAYETVFCRPIQTLFDDPRAWLESIHPDDRSKLAQLADGDRLPDRMENEYRIVRPDGSVRWVRSTVFAIRNAAGATVRLAGVIADITERRALEDQLRQTQKMESLGQLAGGVAHDFNNILAVISQCSGMLAESIVNADPNRELVDEIAKAVTRAVGLTSQLLAFSRKQVSQAVVLDLNAAIKDTRNMLRRIVREDVELALSLEPDLPRVRVDPGGVVQVLMNLVVNARDAMPNGGKLELATRAAETGPVGRAVVLTVTDTGTGMTDDVRARIFEPFFTTKERGRGTGMGLAVVHGIVEQAGGRIEVESRLGVGTTFRVMLPACDAPVDVARASMREITRGTETILVVDDDEHVLDITARALRSRGYDVATATSGHAALRVLDRHDVDLLLTDLVMPKMDGRELAEIAAAAHRGLRILFMSGYTDDDIAQHRVERGNVELVNKPFRVDTLAQHVRRALETATPSAAGQ